jgi:hypothetical protein
LALVRRIIIVLVGISLAILVTVLLLNPDSISNLALNLGLTSPFIRLPLAILIDVVILAVLAVLVRGERAPQPEGGLIVKAQGAIADISVDSARDRMLRAVREVPGVISAEATVKALRGKADVDMDVVVSRESSNLPEKQKEIDRALRQVLNKQLGLQMAGKPRVHIRMDGESTLTPSAELPAPAPVVTVVEPVKPEPIVAAEVKEEPPAPIPVQDTMSLRPDPETKSDTPTSN